MTHTGSLCKTTRSHGQTYHGYTGPTCKDIRDVHYGLLKHIHGIFIFPALFFLQFCIQVTKCVSITYLVRNISCFIKIFAQSMYIITRLLLQRFFILAAVSRMVAKDAHTAQSRFSSV